MTTTPAQWPRIVVLLILAATVVAVLGSVFWSRTESSFTVIPAIASNEETRKAIDLQMAKSDRVYELTLVSLGTLWTLLLARRNEPRIDRRNIVLAASAALALITALWWHVNYLDVMLAAFKLSGATSDSSSSSLPDVFDWRIGHLLTLQFWWFSAGVGLTLATVLTSHLKSTNWSKSA